MRHNHQHQPAAVKALAFGLSVQARRTITAKNCDRRRNVEFRRSRHPEQPEIALEQLLSCSYPPQLAVRALTIADSGRPEPAIL